MTTYRYTLAGLSALGISDISLTYRSLDADTATLTLPMPQASSCPLPWVEGDRVIINDEREADTPRLFNGLVSSITPQLTGGRYVLTVELANAVDVLKRSIYARLDSDGLTTYGQSFYAGGEDTEGESVTSSRAVCEACFDWGEAGHMDCTRQVDIDGTIMGIAGSGTQSCWTLIQSALRWVPDACTAMRYSESGDVLHFLTARGMEPVTIDLTTRSITSSGGGTVATFEAATSCQLKARHDLVPPVCALTGRKNLILPEGGDLHTPGAFIYHVCGSALSTGGGGLTEAVSSIVTPAVINQRPWSRVRGKAAPFDIGTALSATNSLSSLSTEGKTAALAWWRCFGAFAILRKIPADSLCFGTPIFEAVEAEDAFPPPDDLDADSATINGEYEDNTPTNYETPEKWGGIWLFWDGKFPASGDSRKNISGLKWCRGRLSQYVWVKGKPSGVTREKLHEFFDGLSWLPWSDAKKNHYRYTRLSVEGVWINKANKKYQEGTLADPVPPSTTPDSGSSGGGGGGGSSTSDPDYAAALHTYYDATRKLYHDGSIELVGVRGNPSALLATGINIRGLLPEWESMETPCNEIVYEPIARRLTLTVGSRDVLQVNEMLQRQSLGMQQSQSRSNGAAAISNPGAGASSGGTSGGSGGTSEGEESEEEEEVEYISPNIVASHSASKGGSKLKAWEIYAEGDKIFMNGGVTSRGIKVDATDITKHYAAGRIFFWAHTKDGKGVKLRYVSSS